ncbi:hypothetical protein Y1Q_0003234 [Alligator mississippiensis]|uniref:Uncharacterized protein n=1 Tax=Alligator mississippiensis TaxID=8496 RepID=A0A151MDX9_ALLMI|nr:hypothetical protein Y1Q_0003234 [Alligator mississippiensis]
MENHGPKPMKSVYQSVCEVFVKREINNDVHNSWVQKVEANPGFTEIRNVGAGGGDRTRIQNTKQIVKSEVPRRKGNENERV